MPYWWDEYLGSANEQTPEDIRHTLARLIRMDDEGSPWDYDDKRYLLTLVEPLLTRCEQLELKR
jgi:hypothetical protein